MRLQCDERSAYAGAGDWEAGVGARDQKRLAADPSADGVNMTVSLVTGCPSVSSAPNPNERQL